MKVAVCLSGQIRSFNYVRQSLKDHLIDPYNCDVFCHCWHKHDDSAYKNDFNDHDTTPYGKYTDYDITDVVNFLKPISFCFDYPTFSENTKSMLRSITRSNDLKKEYERVNNFKYDVVVRVRWDLLYSEKINLHNCAEKQVYLMDRPGGCGGINDWFAYGNSNTMDTYAKVYNDNEGTERIKQPCPEGILGAHLNANNINVNIIHKTFYIVRADGIIGC